MKKKPPATKKNTKKANGVAPWAKGRTRNVKTLAGSNGNGVLTEPDDRRTTRAIEQLLEKEEWSGARRLIVPQMKREPDCHWLWAMLGLTYYEQRDYEKALKFAKKALALAPGCAMSMFHYAGALSMLGRYRKAIAAYQNILDREVESVASDECGEGLKGAMQLMNDCHYRMGRCFQYLGDKKAARTSYRKFLHNRSHGVPSIYDTKKVKSLLAEVCE